LFFDVKIPFPCGEETPENLRRNAELDPMTDPTFACIVLHCQEAIRVGNQVISIYFQCGYKI